MPGAPVSISSGPSPESWTSIYDYAGGSTLIYSGLARSLQPAQTIAISSVTTANPASFTSSANHGLPTGATITISGATGNWAAMNGTWTVTNTGATTFTIPVNSTAFTGSFNGTVQTNCPQTTRAIWSISKNFYNGSSQITNTMWAVDPNSQAGGTTSPVQVWDNRAALYYS